jgi:lambda family phage portal protein
MKISFELARSANNGANNLGAQIQSPRVQPWHGEALCESASHNKKMARAYDAAMTNNLNADFPLTVGSANAEILGSEAMMRYRSRTLVKDFPTGKGILRTDKNNVCGPDPFRLEMQVGSWSADGKKFTLETKTNRLIKDAWEKAGLQENCTVRRNMGRMEMYHCVEASSFRDGRILIRLHRNFPNNKYRFAIELIECDRLDQNYMGRSPQGNQIRFSVELDKYNAPVAYWILTRHPGDLFMYNGNIPNTYRERVPADEIIFFNNLRDRAEQDLGLPEMDSTIQTLHRARQFNIAHVTAALWSCTKPFFITQEYPTGIPYAGDPVTYANLRDGGVEFGVTGNGVNAPAPGDLQGGGRDKFKTLQPATGEILQLGQKAQLVDPKFPVESAEGFNRDSLLLVATGVGMSFGAVSSDYEKYSFSTARFAEQPQRDNFKVRQNHFIQAFARLHFNEWLESAILSGALDLPISRLEEFQDAASFVAKTWPYVNPVQDAQADIELMEANLKSHTEVRRESENGGTYEDVIVEIANEREMAKGHGIDLTVEVTRPALPKGEPGQTQPATDDDMPPPKRNGNGNQSLYELRDLLLGLGNEKNGHAR